MKKLFLSIFLGILFVNVWYSISYKASCNIGEKTQKEFQTIVRNNLFMFDSFTTNMCKLKKDNLYNICINRYPKYKSNWKQCLAKMLSDGKVWPFTCDVYNLELACMDDSLLNTHPINRSGIVNIFCNYMSDYYIWWKNVFFVNSKHSIFLKILCNTTKIDPTPKFAENMNNKLKNNQIKYYWKLVEDAKKNSLINFWLFWKCKNTDWINTDSSSLNNVNFVCVANDIWNKLAEDEINMWSYIAYWWFTDDNTMIAWQRDFFDFDDMCDNYFSPDDDKDYCKHKNTYKTLKSTQGSLSNILHSFNLFKDVNDIYKIQDIILSEKDKKACKENQSCQNFMSLKNSIYNELYFYTYFLSYYWEKIKNNTSNLQLKKVWNSIKDVDLSTAKEFLQAKKSITVARLSIKKSFDILKNIYWTYPIHVWFLAIIEDFTSLRDDLAKIYTPIDQLRYKLQNVQDLSKH